MLSRSCILLTDNKRFEKASYTDAERDRFYSTSQSVHRAPKCSLKDMFFRRIAESIRKCIFIDTERSNFFNMLSNNRADMRVRKHCSVNKHKNVEIIRNL